MKERKPMDRRNLKLTMWILLLIPYFKPSFIAQLQGLQWLDTLFDVWRLLSAVTVCLFYLYSMLRFRRKPSTVLLCLGGYLFFVALSTALHGSNYWEVLNYVITVGTFCVLLELSLRDGPDMTLDMLFYPLTVMILANLVLMALYPDGIVRGGNYNYSYNFIGIDNLLAPVLIPYIIITILRSTMRCGTLDLCAYVMISVAVLNILLVWAATALLGLAVVLCFLLLFYQRRFQSLFNGLTYLIAAFGMFFGVVLFRLQDVFAFLIEDILGKGLSFTGRTDIWDEAVRMFLLSPWLGYGYAIRGKVYRLRVAKYYHAHNLFLEVLVEGGILAMGCYLGMIYSAVKQLLIYRRHHYACLISAGLISIAVMTTMEPFLDTGSLPVFALLFLGYHVGTLINGTWTEPAGAARRLLLPEDQALI